MTRRAWFAALVGLPFTAAPGFQVRGVLSTTDEPDTFQIGHEFGLVAAPRTEPHRLLTASVNHEVTVHVAAAV